jgi:hypothetical protein
MFAASFGDRIALEVASVTEHLVARYAYFAV